MTHVESLFYRCWLARPIAEQRRSCPRPRQWRALSGLMVRLDARASLPKSEVILQIPPGVVTPTLLRFKPPAAVPHAPRGLANARSYHRPRFAPDRRSDRDHH